MQHCCWPDRQSVSCCFPPVTPVFPQYDVFLGAVNDGKKGRPGRCLRPGGKGRDNRSFEYDGLGDQYARFLVDELVPEVGKKYNLTSDPKGRALCGISSGGICAFTVAWNHPDQFSLARDNPRS